MYYNRADDRVSGIKEAEFRVLRSRLLGTPTLTHGPSNPNRLASPSASPCRNADGRGRLTHPEGTGDCKLRAIAHIN